MKRYEAVFFLFTVLFLASALRAAAATFTGIVMDATAYSFIVKNSEEVKIFQIRQETQGSRNLYPEDLVTVFYREEEGVLIAENIVLLKR
jgi:hypothetical protein